MNEVSHVDLWLVCLLHLLPGANINDECHNFSISKKKHIFYHNSHTLLEDGGTITPVYDQHYKTCGAQGILVLSVFVFDSFIPNWKQNVTCDRVLNISQIGRDVKKQNKKTPTVLIWLWNRSHLTHVWMHVVYKVREFVIIFQKCSQRCTYLSDFYAVWLPYLSSVSSVIITVCYRAGKPWRC